jgi:hypothetical protein
LGNSIIQKHKEKHRVSDSSLEHENWFINFKLYKSVKYSDNFCFQYWKQLLWIIFQYKI